MSPIRDSSDINMSNQWQTLTVEQAITYGKDLRKLKTRSNKVGYGYPSNGAAMRIFFPKQSCIKRRHNKRKNFHSPQTRKKKNVCIKKKRQTKCTLRIAELAIPSKRQCLHSWKHNSHILPPIMIERLKQMILDQKPMILIKDAYGCFTKKPKKSRKRLKQVDHSGNKGNNGVGPNKNIQNLCSKFALEMYKKLMYPKNNMYCSTLQNYYEVLSNEINKVMRCRKKTKLSNKIQDEMTRKIAVWIAMVLEETKLKILSEQLQELEEEEGPALDFIDALIDKVLDICAPRPEEEPFEFQKLKQEDEPSTTSINTEQFIFKQIDDVINTVTGRKSSKDESDDEKERLSVKSLDQETSNVNTINSDSEEHLLIDKTDKDELLEDNMQAVAADNDPSLVVEQGLDQQDDFVQPHVSDISITSNDEEDLLNYNLSETQTDKVTSDDHGDEEAIGGIPNSSTQSVTSNKQLAWAENNKQKFNIGPANEHLLNSMDEEWPHRIPVHSVKVTASAVISIGSLGTIKEMEETKPDTITISGRSSKSSEDNNIIMSQLLTNEPNKDVEIVDSLKPNVVKSETTDQVDGIIKRSFEATTMPEITTSDKGSKRDIAKGWNGMAKQLDQKDLIKAEAYPRSINTDKIQNDEYDNLKSIKHIFTKPQTDINENTKETKDKTKMIKESADTDYTDDEDGAEKVNLDETMKKAMRDRTGNGDNSKLNRAKGVENSHTPSKYIVKLETAPSWVRRTKENNKFPLKQTEARKWCQDLLYVLDKYESMNGWLNKTSTDILHVEHRKELKRCCSRARQNLKSREIFQSINKTANIYMKMNKDIKWILLYRKFIYQRHRERREKFSGSNSVCSCNKFLRKSLQ